MTDLAAARDVSSPEDTWQRARLLPTVGIKGQEEQERRATSSLLAVMHAVPEFGHALLRELGAPKSPIIKTFTEVRFKDAAGKSQIPDGAIVCERGKKRWSCLVEVKTGSAALRDEQVASYLDLARDNGFDGVLTISNQITAVSTDRTCTTCARPRGLATAPLAHGSSRQRNAARTGTSGPTICITSARASASVGAMMLQLLSGPPRPRVAIVWLREPSSSPAARVRRTARGSSTESSAATMYVGQWGS